MVVEENPARSIEYFVNETSKKSLVITGMLSGMLNNPEANKLLETPETVILPLMNTEEAKWAVGRVFHHGKMMAQVVLGVIKHTWASYQCPADHENLSGKTVAHWADFSTDAGIHPMAKIAVAPLKACTCTTYPSKVVVKLSTR